MNTKLDQLLGWCAVLGFLILPFFLLLAISIPGTIASGKQVTFNRARASLTAALNDSNQGAGREPKQYGYFVVYACTNVVTVDGRRYPLAFCTTDGYQFAGEGRLAVTTNQQFIWLDIRRGAKLIASDYRVSKWRSGY